MALLYNGLDTLEVSTSDFYIRDVDMFNEAKEMAKELPSKEYPFEYELIDGSKNIRVHSCFIMKSTSFNPFAWSFYDKDKKFLFSSVFSDKKKNFKVRILSKAFFTEELEVLLGELQEILDVFGIDVSTMKVRRLDWATDISFPYKKTQKFIKDSFFSKCVFMQYSSLESLSKVDVHNIEFDSKIYCTGFTFGSKAVKFRLYDKILEAIQKYKEDEEKNELLLDNYYPCSELMFSDISLEKKSTDIDMWMKGLLAKYLKDKKQVIRFEYQFRNKILENKFRFVKDLNYEDMTSFVFTVFKKHTGFRKEEMDKDLQFYEKSIGSTDYFHNKYKKAKPTLEGRINKAIVQVGAGLSNLGIALSERSNKTVPLSEIRNVLRRHENFFYSKHYEKMYLNSKVIFSQQGIKDGILDFRAFSDYLTDYRREISK